MSCSDSPAGNSFLVDSLISARTESGGDYYQGGGVYFPPGSDLPYGLPNCGFFPGLSKRNEATCPNMVPTSNPYMSGMQVWLDTARSCRMDQSVQQVTSCSFSPNIKEENTYSIYESGKTATPLHTEDLCYSGVSSGSCPSNDSGMVPVPGYFRLSQTYATSKVYHDVQSNSSHFTLQPPVHFDTPPSSSTSVEPARRDNKDGSSSCMPGSQKDEETGVSSSTEESPSPEPRENCKESPKGITNGK